MLKKNQQNIYIDNNDLSGMLKSPSRGLTMKDSRTKLHVCRKGNLHVIPSSFTKELGQGAIIKEYKTIKVAFKRDTSHDCFAHPWKEVRYESALKKRSTVEVKRCIWNKESVYALGPYRLFSRILGIWPPNYNDFGSRIRFVGCIILQLKMTYDMFREFTSGSISMFDIVNFIGILATTFVSLLKTVMVSLQRIKLNSIVQSAVKDWSIPRNGESREIMKKHARIGRCVFAFELCSAYSSALLLAIISPPTLGQTASGISEIGNVTIAPILRNVPMGSGRSVADLSTSLYLTSYLLQLLQLLSLCTCTVGIDGLFFGFSMHLCAQLNILNNNIAQLGRDIVGKNIRKKFKELIKRQNYLIDLVNYVEDIFHLVLLGQLAATATHITLLGIELLFGLRDGDFVLLMYASVTMSALLAQIYAYSYAGDYLSLQIMNIRDAAYNCSWYEFSPRLTRDVMFVIARSNRSFYLTVGKIYRMNIESFTTLIKQMMSLFTVLKLVIID